MTFLLLPAVIDESMAEGKTSRLALVFISADLISNEQKTEILHLIDNAFRSIDGRKFSPIETLLNNLVEPNGKMENRRRGVFDQFRSDASSRQILAADDGSLVAFLHCPNFHSVLNVLKEVFGTAHCVSIVFLGQQLESNGAWLLNDCALTVEHLLRLFDENPSTIVTEDLQLVLPFVVPTWSRLLAKRVKRVEINEISPHEPNDNPFGETFLRRFRDHFARETNRVDLNEKLIPRDNAGAGETNSSRSRETRLTSFQWRSTNRISTFSTVNRARRRSSPFAASFC